MEFEFTVTGVSQNEALRLMGVFPLCVFRLDDGTLKVNARLPDTPAKDLAMTQLLRLTREGMSVRYRKVE